MSDCFISYRRTPSAPVATVVQTKLQSDYGYDVYLDTTRTDGTKVSFPERLMQAIEAAPVFVCVLGERDGEHTLQSEWVLKEIQRAYDLKKFCVPVFQESYHPLENMPPAVDYLLGFDGVHIFDQKNVMVDESVRQLAALIRPQRQRKRRGWLVGAAILLVLALVGFGAVLALNGRENAGADVTDTPTLNSVQERETSEADQTRVAATEADIRQTEGAEDATGVDETGTAFILQATETSVAVIGETRTSVAKTNADTAQNLNATQTAFFTTPSLAGTIVPLVVTIQVIDSDSPRITFVPSASGGSGVYTRFEWDFGEGSAGYSFEPITLTQAYPQAGIYLVTLTVTDDAGNQTTTQADVVISVGLLDLAEAGIESNEDWTPYEQNFDDVPMVLVPAGSFVMGSTEEEINAAGALCLQATDDETKCEPSAFADESPTSYQKFATPFWIDKTEVTRAQYQLCVDDYACSETGSSAFSIEPEQPINNVTWFQAQAYCEWHGGRLPTEAEWEYAARGPNRLIFPWGDSFDTTQVNHCDRSCGSVAWVFPPMFVHQEIDDGYPYSAPVGTYPMGSSWVGALDMSGNVWEWTNSLEASYPYVANDGREDDTGSSLEVLRIVRGGSFHDSISNLRSTNRIALTPEFEYGFFGFRCVRDYMN